MKDYNNEKEIVYGNRTSHNLKYLNQAIDKMNIDFELNLLPKWLRLNSKKKEKTLEEKIRDCDRDEKGIPYTSPP